MTPPLIHRPEHVSPLRRSVSGIFTGGLWIFYAYLWVPLLTLAAWMMGFHTAWYRLYLQQNVLDPFVLAALPVIAFICALLLIGWAEYNRKRFQGADQRRRRSDVSEVVVDDCLGAHHAVGESLRQHRAMRVTLDKNAVPIAVSVLELR